MLLVHLWSVAMVTTLPVDQFEWATVNAEMQERGTEIRCKVHQRFKGLGTTAKSVCQSFSLGR